MMLVSQLDGMSILAEEIREQIISSTPVSSLPNLMLVSQIFYRQTKPYFYRSIYYISTDPDIFEIRNSRKYDPKHNARIIRLPEFLRTITQHPELRSYIQEVKFANDQGWDGNFDDHTIDKALKLLPSSTLHLALGYKSVTLALSNAIGSLDFIYPSIAERDCRTLQDAIYEIFAISSLRNLTLRNARYWAAFNPLQSPDETRLRSSNVECLYLPNTIPMDVDLAEILTWPKALKKIRHIQEADDDNKFGNLNSPSQNASPKRFLQSVAVQRETLEEIEYNNGWDSSEYDYSTFSPTLIREFTKLRLLSVPIECFAAPEKRRDLLYAALPPALEKICLESDLDTFDADYEALLHEFLPGVVDHRDDYYPALTHIVWHQKEDIKHMNETFEDALFALRTLITRLAPIFEQSNIRFEILLEDESSGEVAYLYE